MKLICLLKQITAIITLYTLQTKFYIAPVVLMVTDVLCLLQRDTACTTFSYTKMQDSKSWHVVTWRNKWNLGDKFPLVNYCMLLL